MTSMLTSARAALPALRSHGAPAEPASGARANPRGRPTGRTTARLVWILADRLPQPEHVTYRRHDGTTA